MTYVIRAAAAAAAIALAVPAAAQQPPAQQPAAQQRPPAGRFGLGVGFAQADAPFLSGTQIYVPMNLAPNLRIEPFIALDHIDFDSNGGNDSTFTLGAGAFFVQPVAPQVQIYAGGRLALNWVSSETAGAAPDESEQTNFFLGAVLGGEYLLHPRFAVGAEATLGYVKIGEVETTDGATGVVTQTPDGSEIATQAAVFVRVYLF